MIGGASVLPLEMLQNGIAAHARHHHVEDDEVGMMLIDHVLALLAVAGLNHAIALFFQEHSEAVAQFHIVVDDQNDFVCRHARWSSE